MARHLTLVPEAPAARVAGCVELTANGTRGGAFVVINGETVGRIGVPHWGWADREEHRLFTAHLGERQVGDTRGMDREEARRAVITAWQNA